MAGVNRLSKDEEIYPVWFNPENPWQRLIAQVVYDGENYALSVRSESDFIRDPHGLGLICSQKDLFEWGWKPISDLQLATEVGFVKP